MVKILWRNGMLLIVIGSWEDVHVYARRGHKTQRIFESANFDVLWSNMFDLRRTEYKYGNCGRF